MFKVSFSVLLKIEAKFYTFNAKGSINLALIVSVISCQGFI